LVHRTLQWVKIRVLYPFERFDFRGKSGFCLGWSFRPPQ
jgi:hypothetical protein